ncbi:aldo/keto reductase [Amycolatopsis sp. Hca4]|uniref:aldo/keto reductase n=1 Tax=Amycolatopsis sp. Hca4 TaxID=2742131 RepID=UPI0015920142|nr:aldo/keto reductase [Amycolatopsis sp. Hca4]QKV75814.1 aldo/keto reductase [Amycolatopsis sp. Hca4]
MPHLGATSIDVFPLTLGGNTFGWTSDTATSHAVLDAYVDGGGNFIDTADSYSAWAPGNSGGESETVLGEWLTRRRNRSDVVLATKVSRHPQYRGLAASTITGGVDASLKRLQTDYIDLYYAHFDDPDTPLAETAAAFDSLVRTGKIRAIGLSNYSAERIRQWFTIARDNGLHLPVALQPHYNLVKRVPYETEIEPIAVAENLAVTPYYALASGFLTGKYRSREDMAGASREQMANAYFSDSGLAVVEALVAIAEAHEVAPATVALAWLRGRSTITAPIASARTPEQLPALMQSVGLELTEADRARLDDVSSRVAA